MLASPASERIDAELLRKQELMKGNPEWHFIGSLQSRKAKSVVNAVSYIHSLDRLSLAKEIEKRAEGTVRCFVQVNTSLEPSKHGMKKKKSFHSYRSFPVSNISLLPD